MDKGNYYETGITEQFHEILGNTTERGLVLDIGMNIGWVRVSTETFRSLQITNEMTNIIPL